MEKYNREGKLGEGAHGVVYKATIKKTGQVVAIKKIRFGELKEGANFTALREIRLLQELRHENVISLIDVFILNQNIHLVVEYCVTDLEHVIRDKSLVLTVAHVKSIMQMLLEALQYCHKHWVLHRDLKPGNLFIAPDGQLKLADFGLSRQFGSPNPKYTSVVVTRWYRPPELFFGSKQYGQGVDMWSCGCVFGELLLRSPLFAGDTDIDQLSRIFSSLGSPKESDWPMMKTLPAYMEFTHHDGIPLGKIFTAAPDDAVKLIAQMLKYDPQKRVAAADALFHEYFQNAPAPSPPELIPLPKQRKRKEKPAVVIKKELDHIKTNLADKFSEMDKMDESKDDIF